MKYSILVVWEGVGGGKTFLCVMLKGFLLTS